MADKSRMLMKKKERKEKEASETTKDVKEVKNEGEKAVDNGEVPSAEAAATNGAVANGENGDFQVEPMELPPFEIIAG